MTFFVRKSSSCRSGFREANRLKIPLVPASTGFFFYKTLAAKVVFRTFARLFM